MESTNESKLKVSEALEKIRSHVKIEPEVGIILGSGLGSMVDGFKDTVTIKFEEIPNFPKSTVEGHRGEIVAGNFSGVDVIALSGRVHYYEGYTMQEVCLPVRMMAGLGVKKLIVTNAGGAINEDFSTGDIIVITDHINMMGDNPLKGSWDFVDMTDAYNRILRILAHDSAVMLDIELKEGVYLALSGPSYETPAEIRMLRTLGADIVGMSTVPEVIVANSLGMEVLGLSIITNMAAGILNQKLSHKEVIQVTREAGGKFIRLIEKIIKSISEMKKNEMAVEK